MPKQVQCYLCIDCRDIYSTEEEAVACESSHKDFENLKVVEVKYTRNGEDYHSDNNRNYPEKIRVEDSTRSGDMADYGLIHAGSVEDFEPYNKPIDGF